MCEQTKSNDTLDRRKGDKTLDAGQKGESNHRRCYNNDVSFLHSESTEEEPRAWTQLVALCQLSDTGAKYVVEVDCVHAKVREFIVDRLQNRKLTHFGSKQKKWPDSGVPESSCAMYQHDEGGHVCVPRIECHRNNVRIGQSGNAEIVNDTTC